MVVRQYNERDPDDGKMKKYVSKFISSIELLNRTGLSRATLNNYIKAGILPRPVVKKPNDDLRSKARRIGYFPDSVLDTLSQMIQYKKEGHSMEEIRSRMKRKSADLPRQSQKKGVLTTSVGLNPSERSGESENAFFREYNRSAYTPADASTEGVSILLSGKGKDVHDLFEQSMPLPLSFSVLAADLQDSIKLRAEMAPEEYLRLINQIWICVKTTFEKKVGIYGKRAGIGPVYYFLKDSSSNYLMSPISCALELRKKMRELSDEWKRGKGWSRDLYLNIGINEGYEFFGKISAAPTVEVIPLGDTANDASQLSDFARCGSIWTTKNLLARLDEQERKKIRYGIKSGQANDGVLIENTFSRISDLVAQDRDKYLVFTDISTMTVTEIHDLH